VTITTTDVTEKNFTARTQTYSIYGTVTELGGSPVAGAALSLFKNSLHIQSTISNSSGQYSFGGLSNGTYTITIDSGCVPVLQDMSATIDCASVERNFVCEAGLGESKRQEAAARLNRLKTFDGIDNKGRQADNGDMETQPDKDNPSAFSLQPSARIEASVAEYLFYHCDHLGTTRLITDNSGAVVSRHDYEPFGVEIAPVVETANNTHRFTGHERDANTGYDYMHYRSYGSNIGRFMKPDNITGNPLNPQSWNLYSYVRGNPVNFNDPTGHEAAEPLPQINKTSGETAGLSGNITAPTDKNPAMEKKTISYVVKIEEENKSITAVQVSLTSQDGKITTSVTTAEGNTTKLSAAKLSTMAYTVQAIYDSPEVKNVSKEVAVAVAMRETRLGTVGSDGATNPMQWTEAGTSLKENIAGAMGVLNNYVGQYGLYNGLRAFNGGGALDKLPKGIYGPRVPHFMAMTPSKIPRFRTVSGATKDYADCVSGICDEMVSTFQ